MMHVALLIMVKSVTPIRTGPMHAVLWTLIQWQYSVSHHNASNEADSGACFHVFMNVANNMEITHTIDYRLIIHRELCHFSYWLPVVHDTVVLI